MVGTREAGLRGAGRSAAERGAARGGGKRLGSAQAPREWAGLYDGLTGLPGIS